MLRLILALLLSIIAMLIIGPRVIPIIRKLHFGQTIYELGPESHRVKQGTPLMGGLMFSAVSCLVALVLHLSPWQGVNDFLLILVAVSIASMLIGFADDYIKSVKKRSMGLSGWQKVAGQVLVSAAFATYCYFSPYVGSKIIVPFLNIDWDLGIFYIPLMTLVIIFMINSANLQDGCDGLLSSVAGIGNIAWSMMAVFVASMAVSEGLAANYRVIAIFCMALAGACFGFLRFNRYPAMIFMGDTGSMFIGGATVGVALLMRMPLFLLLISSTMVLSSLSGILQRAYFKLTHGKRIFKMSPLHHHFEKCGWSETQIVMLYAIYTGVMCLIAVLSLSPIPLV